MHRRHRRLLFLEAWFFFPTVFNALELMLYLLFLHSIHVGLHHHSVLERVLQVEGILFFE